MITVFDMSSCEDEPQHETPSIQTPVSGQPNLRQELQLRLLTLDEAKEIERRTAR